MAENKAKKVKPESGQHIRKRFWFVAIVILIVAICCYFLLKTGLLDFQTVDEQLAAIEAARAIPDEENAAIIYYQLMQDYDESLLSPDFMDEDLDYLTRLEPWSSKDYPELAEWLEDRQDIISTLLEASKKEKCRFPIILDFQQMPILWDRLQAMRQWALLLIRAANNDIADGRIDACIQKCNCLNQMANHLYQQPAEIDFLFGVVVEALALDRIKSLILQSDATEKHLKTIEAALPHTKDNWAEVSSKIIEFETLYERKNVSLFNRVRYWRFWRGVSSTKDSFDRFQEHYLRQLAYRRGNRILIALRRCRNKTGQWPESLDDIKSLAPAEIFVDPINGNSFVYKLTEENFTLYSKGKNNIDEDGIRRGTFDPNDFKWPKTEEDDIPIWSPKTRKTTKEEKANDEKQ